MHGCDYCKNRRFGTVITYFDTFEELEDHVEGDHMPPYRKDS
jgi:hypothetical protein